jgi:hypothetical protein
LTQQNQFDASSSLAGYLYQCRLALLLSLQTLKRKPNCHISIEKFDDISFGSDNYAECIIQAKHHVKAKNLTDSSADVWKTFRIWIEGFKDGGVTNAETKRTLITTALAAQDSALIKLRPTADRDVPAAHKALKAIAQSSKNSVTQAGRDAYLSLTDSEAQVLLSSVDIIDGSPSLPDVWEEIKGELILLAPTHAEEIAEALEGWWLKIVSLRLVGKDSSLISLQDIIKKANEIGNAYGPEKLPLSEPESLGEKSYSESDESEMYVKQMRLVGISLPIIQRAIRDYYRASTQRSKWARETLLLDGEAARYDAKLRDRWERRFDADCTNLSHEDDLEKQRVGQKIFHWAHQEQIEFRNVVETWITSGSFQGLADRLEIGWHPEYVTHLNKRKDDE